METSMGERKHRRKPVAARPKNTTRYATRYNAKSRAAAEHDYGRRAHHIVLASIGPQAPKFNLPHGSVNINSAALSFRRRGAFRGAL
jgi:hypothetical protein